MNELLFGNLKEKEAFENILALNQIRKCDEIISKYENEINDLKEEMISILKEENIDESYIYKIHKYRNIIDNLDGDNSRINELQNEIENNEERIREFQEKVSEVEKELEDLKKEIFETDDPSKVIECQNEIENNNARLNDLSEIINTLISENTPLLIEKEYLIAKNDNYDLSIPNYDKDNISCDLNKISNDFDQELSKLELPIRENIEFCQKKIQNREKEIEKNTSRKNKVINAFPNALGLDLNKALNEINDLLCELDISYNGDKINNENMFGNEEEKEESNTIKIPLEEDKDNEIEIDIDNTKEENETNDNEKISNNDDIESVSYVLSDGESLANIAEKVYPSKDNWEAIYFFNKDTIDNFLISNGISDDFDTVKELSEDTSLFKGIKLEIPTDYNYKI